jgi:hypothetical protein
MLFIYSRKSIFPAATHQHQNMSINLTIKGYYMERRGMIKQLQQAQWQHNKDVKKKYEEWRKKFAEPAPQQQPSSSRRKLTWIDECGKGDLCNTIIFSYYNSDNDIYELLRQPATEPDEDTETEEEDD